MATQAKFFKMPNTFDRERWRDYGKHLMRHDEDLDDKLDNLPWAIGDWLVEGVDGGLKSRALKNEALNITKGRYSWGTLSNFMTVSRSVEPSRRREDLTYSTHQLVARFSPEDQDRLLDMKVNGWPDIKTLHGNPVAYSFRQLKGLIAEMQERGELPVTDRKPSPARFVTVNIKVPATEQGGLKALAAAKSFWRTKKGGDPFRPERNPDVGRLVGWMASQYYKEHKTELDELLKQPKS